MANKRVSQLPAATTIDDNDLLVVEQGQTAKSISGGLLRGYTTANIVSAEATTLEAEASATAAYNAAQRKLTIGVPRGAKGDKGDKGDKGENGALETDVSGLLKGNNGAVTAAVEGVDYVGVDAQTGKALHRRICKKVISASNIEILEINTLNGGTAFEFNDVLNSNPDGVIVRLIDSPNRRDLEGAEIDLICLQNSAVMIEADTDPPSGNNIRIWCGGQSGFGPWFLRKTGGIAHLKHLVANQWLLTGDVTPTVIPTSETGLLKGDNGVITAAVEGVDYAGIYTGNIGSLNNVKKIFGNRISSSILVRGDSSAFCLVSPDKAVSCSTYLFNGNSAEAITVRIVDPAGATPSDPDAEFHFIRAGIRPVLFSDEDGATILCTVAEPWSIKQNGVAHLKRIGAQLWILYGDLEGN